MKKFFKIFAVAALACVTFVACEKEFDAYTPAEPETGECYEVYFPESESSFELDPSDPTSLTFPVARKNTNGAITVPVVVKVGGDVFTAEPIAFAAGEAESTLTVNFPNAEVGVAYTVDVAIEDPMYASTYGTGSTGKVFTMSRVKWNFLGTGVFTYNFWWGGTDPAQPLEQRDGTNIYRLRNWGGGVTLYFEMIDGVPTIAKQFIGDVHPSYGNVFVQSISDESYYDDETKTYYFMNKYTVAAGSFGSDYETFQLTNPAE